jgi:hypothetical protein
VGSLILFKAAETGPFHGIDRLGTVGFLDAVEMVKADDVPDALC